MVGGELGQVHRSAAGQGFPLGRQQVKLAGPLLVKSTAVDPGSNRVPHSIGPVGLQLRPAGLGGHELLGSGFRQAGQRFQLPPELGDQMVQRVSVARQGERAQLQGKPAVGGAQHQGAGRPVARLESAQVRVTTAAGGQAQLRRLAEGVRHRPALTAFVARHEHAGGLPGAAAFRHLEGMSGFRFSIPVGVVQPGKVIQMPVVAGQHESGGHGDRLRSTPARARMHLAAQVRLHRMPQQFKEAAIGSAKAVAARAP